MKKSILIISGILMLTLCACKGRTASAPVANGDTVEVLVNDHSAESDTSDAKDLVSSSETPTFEKVN